MTKRKALIAGATGVAGRNLLRHLLRTGVWEIVALSRRTPDIEGNLVEAVAPVAGGLEHIHAMHGTKWYRMNPETG